MPQHEIDELADRLAKTETRLRRLKVLVAILLVVAVALLLPPVRAIAGGVLIVGGIVGAVLLLIGSVMYALDRYFPSSNSRRADASYRGAPNDSTK